jgi:hypothetical protein
MTISQEESAKSVVTELQALVASSEWTVSYPATKSHPHQPIDIHNQRNGTPPQEISISPVYEQDSETITGWKVEMKVEEEIIDTETAPDKQKAVHSAENMIRSH